LADPESQTSGRIVLAVDVPPDRSGASIAVAAERLDGSQHLELIEHRVRLSDVAARLADLQSRHNPYTVVLDPGSSAGSLIPDLERLDVRVSLVSMREYGQACGALYDGVVAEQVHHISQPPLDAAILAAKRRTLGDAWAWDRKDGTDISPLVAVTLAKHGLDVELGGRRDPAMNVW
jgi:hypothetical protein